MSSRVLVLGGSGFVGRHVVERLQRAGALITVPTRRLAAARSMWSQPRVHVTVADVMDPPTLARLVAEHDAVVNLVGILHGSEQQFERAHVELPRRIAEACAQAGGRRLVHISALGADASGPSEYQRSKAAGERAIEAAGPDIAWTILRPSVVFGRGDSFLNLFADLARMFPVLPLTGAGCRFQPVYVEDVAEAVFQSLTRPEAAGQTFELAGPTVYTLRQLVEYVSDLVGKPRPVIGLPEGIGMLQARLMELAPQPLMSRDNVRSMRVDNVAHGEPMPFGLSPTALEAVAPPWLGEARPRALYYPFRRHARR